MKIRLILKQLIKERDVTIAQLSRKSGVPRNTIDNWLSGLAPKNINDLKKVSDILDVSLDYLCFGEDLRNQLEEHRNEIVAGNFELVLRPIKKGAKYE